MEFWWGRLLGRCRAHENTRNARKKRSILSRTCPAPYDQLLSELVEELEQDIAPSLRQYLISEKHLNFLFSVDRGPQRIPRDFLELFEVVLRSFWLGYTYKILSIELSRGPIPRIQTPFKSYLVGIGPQQRRRFRDLQLCSWWFGRCAHTHQQRHKEKTIYCPRMLSST